MHIRNKIINNTCLTPHSDRNISIADKIKHTHKHKHKHKHKPIAAFVLSSLMVVHSGVVYAEDIYYDGTQTKEDIPSLEQNILQPVLGSSSNIVRIVNNDKGIHIREIYGGYTASDNIKDNQVFIENGSFLSRAYGGRSYNGEVTGNVVNIKGVGSATHRAYGGYSSNGDVIGNTLIFSDGATIDDSFGAMAYGGYSENGGNVIGNTLDISGSIVVSGAQLYVYGGNSTSGNVIGNIVNIKDSHLLNGRVTAGITYSAVTRENILNLSGNAQIHSGTAGGSGSNLDGPKIYLSEGNILNLKDNARIVEIARGGSSDVGLVTKNVINLSDNASVRGSDYHWEGTMAGESGFGDATYNVLNLKDHSYIERDAYGAKAAGGIYDKTMEGGTTTGNAIYLQDNTKIGGVAYGGWSRHGNSNENSVNVTDHARIEKDVYGGYAKGDASGFGHVLNNVVNLSGEASIGGEIYGGWNGYGDAIGNVVNVLDKAHVTKNIYGGYSTRDDRVASKNRVNISGNAHIQGSIYGGYSEKGDATHNIVNISGTPLFDVGSNIVGGGAYGDNLTGNTLNYAAHNIRVNRIEGFENYNFTLNPLNANSSIALIEAKYIRLGTATNPAIIKVVGVQAGQRLHVDDEFILMQSNNITGVGNGTTSKGIAQQGISFVYDIETYIDSLNNQITATVIGSKDTSSGGNNGNGNNNGNNGLGGRVNPQLKSLSEGRLSSSLQVNRAAETIAYDTFNNITAQNNHQGIGSFAQASASNNRYKSGSHVDSKDYILSGGISYQGQAITAAAFIEGGWGSYDSYNSFYNAADVHGDGRNTFIGAGIFGRYDFEQGFYTDASVRAGSSNNKFNTNDIYDHVSFDNADYKIRTHYLGMHAGTGYLFNVNEQLLLDFSAKYLWTKMGGKDVMVANDPFQFKSINSHRVRIDGAMNYIYNPQVNLMAGLGYEYELDGEAKATTHNYYDIEAPSVKGGTGILSLGINIKPTTNEHLSFDMKAQGYLGKRRGVGLSFNMRYDFK